MNNERLYQVIVAPHISEKATLIAEANNQYTFKVSPDATKREIKLAVEQLFEVTVLRVNTVNIKGKTKRTARGFGKRNDIRKAYVTLAEGQEIELGGE
ncbi:50S ribosomal protein L23 [Litorivicinus lipolyticus]|jgi:large subunit ribosomal protein L23|uniref:Large ribosomal subunit protein uL23 n=1 Tax=Litorivicinus lipolyticus TaxID=418701 RepID=A0A5Q2Q892_9GAMM|nr:50S ribosomal protein L23 [Litorivicinus lipolyticus]QGG80859.1 50S ribosomal protein L23 [Litorivicinus lipolyticus]